MTKHQTRHNEATQLCDTIKMDIGHGHIHYNAGNMVGSQGITNKPNPNQINKYDSL